MCIGSSLAARQVTSEYCTLACQEPKNNPFSDVLKLNQSVLYMDSDWYDLFIGHQWLCTNATTRFRSVTPFGVTICNRCIILAERIEACVAADGAGRGSLSPDELRDIFVVNRWVIFAHEIHGGVIFRVLGSRQNAVHASCASGNASSDSCNGSPNDTIREYPGIA